MARYFRLQGMSSDEVSSAADSLHGIEKDLYLVKLARLHVSVLTKSHPCIQCADSLALVTERGQPLEEVMPVEGYDVLVTNPPFGAKIVAANASVLKTFTLARKWMYSKEDKCLKPTSEIRPQVPPQVLFVERCFELLREGGRLGMVVPESLMSNKSYSACC